MKSATVAIAACFLAIQIPAFSEAPPAGEEEINTAHDDAEAMLGTYVGAFGPRKITISLDRVVGKSVTGYSIVGGNERAFSGAWSKEGADFDVIAMEPGDDR